LFDPSIDHQFIAQTATLPECLVVINSGWLNASYSVSYKGASLLRQHQLPDFHQGVEQIIPLHVDTLQLAERIAQQRRSVKQFFTPFAHRQEQTRASPSTPV
jgi:hypothetical protein